MTDSPRFVNADGTATLYALGCGYVDTYSVDGKGYYLSDTDAVMLSYNGCTFDVHVRTPDTYWRGTPKWITDSETRAQYRADWFQFDTLTEARRFWRRIRTDIRKRAQASA